MMPDTINVSFPPELSHLTKIGQVSPWNWCRSDPAKMLLLPRGELTLPGWSY